jgi:hypothetical protein
MSKVLAKDSNRLVTRKEDIHFIPARYEHNHFITYLEDIVLSPSKHSVISDFKTTNLEHLKDWHKKVLKNPKHKEIVKEGEIRRPSITKEQRDSVHRYTHDNLPINSALRQGENLGALKTHVKNLDSVVNHPLKHDTVVYRGIDNKIGKQLSPRSSFHDFGYHGTTLDPEVAEDIKPLSDYSARIFLKRGDKGGYLPKARGKYPDKDSEKEFLLPRDQQYKVLGHHFDKTTNKTYVDMEVHNPNKTSTKKKVESSLKNKIDYLLKRD